VAAAVNKEEEQQQVTAVARMAQQVAQQAHR
jgi:hypothetical protein